MRIQVIFRSSVALVLLLAALQPQARADDDSKWCFDFSKKIVTPLKAPIDLKVDSDNSISGEREEGLTWAAMRGVVNKPMKQVLALLLDHNTTKSSRVDEMEVKELDQPDFLARHQVKYVIKPFLFITVKWLEDWGYALTKGTPDNPEEVVISYHKTEGTSHIKHLCGNYVLRKNGPDSTDLYQYEEARATQRSVQDTLNGLAGTMKTLRK